MEYWPLYRAFPQGWRARVSRTAAEAESKMNIGTLTAMLIGYKRPSYLRKIERLKGSDLVLGLLERVIPKENKKSCKNP